MTSDGTQELDENQEGELYIRSPNVAQGYWAEPGLTSKTFLPDGWLRTGDLGYYDSERNWYVKDRIQVRASLNSSNPECFWTIVWFIGIQDAIYAENGEYSLPTDLESALLGIPGVEDAGITPVPL